MSSLTASARRTAYLCSLPIELKSIIVDILHTVFLSDPRDLSDSPCGLISLGATNRAWHDIVVPQQFRDVNLQHRPNMVISTFVQSIGPRYGRHCQSLRFSLLSRYPGRDRGEKTFDLLSDPYEIDKNSTTHIIDSVASSGYQRDEHTLFWQAERGTLLTSALALMPNVTSLQLTFGNCVGDQRVHRWRCGCLLTYNRLSSSLSPRPFLTLDVDFGEHPVRLGSDEIVWAILDSGFTTMKRIRLFRRGSVLDDEFNDFHLNDSLPLISSLPQLEDLELNEVCTYAKFASLDWTDSNLRNLNFTVLERTEKEDMTEVKPERVSFALAKLPSQLQHLTLRSRRRRKASELSKPFPPQLQDLQNLTLRIPLTKALLEYVRPCVASTVEFHISAALSSNMVVLADVLRSTEAFPKLDRLHIYLTTGDLVDHLDFDEDEGEDEDEQDEWRDVRDEQSSALLTQICLERGIRLRIHVRGLQPAFQNDVLIHGWLQNSAFNLPG